MPSLLQDFMNADYWDALGSAIFNGLIVLLVISAVATAFTFATGGTQPKKWPKSEH